MLEAVERFVEQMGVSMEADGMPRIAGRIFGFLLVHEGSYPLDTLAERLRVSKASVSTNARLLEQLGLAERVAMPGDRRDFYRMRPDAWERTLRVAQRRWERLRQVLAEAVATLPAELGEGRERLLEAERFHQLLIGEADRLLERWGSDAG